ncbi:hypothetical protein BDD12DRAFT_922770 [Trichophaea hybrida]|nr:hypothetical protein BDD12DRAFT_922770 [Trichophaea hybrida]
MATFQRAKRQKMRKAAKKHQAMRLTPSKVDDSNKGSAKQAEAEKDPAKDPAKDPKNDRGKNPEKNPEETSVENGWRPKVSKEYIMKCLDKHQTAATKMQVSQAWAVLRTPEANEDAWEANRTFAKKIWRESGITTAAQGRDRFWTTYDDIIAQSVWEEWRDVYAISNGNHDGTAEAIGSLNESRGEHYVWTQVFPPVQHLTPIVSHSRAADPDNKLQAALLRLAKDTPAHPMAATFADWIIEAGCEVGELFMWRYYKMFFGRGIRIGVPKAWRKIRGKLIAKDIRWGICLLPMPTMVSLRDAIHIIDVCQDASLLGCLGPYRGDPTEIHEHDGTPLFQTKCIHAWLQVTAGENVAAPVVLVLECNSMISSWYVEVGSVESSLGYALELVCWSFLASAYFYSPSSPA